MSHLPGADRSVPTTQVWTCSWFGRAVCTALSVLLVGLAFGPPRQGDRVVVDACLFVSALAILIAAWTSRLELSDGTLTATNFFRARSMALVEVHDVTWSVLLFGGKIRRANGTGIRTLVSGRTWDELWTPRATKIEQEILMLARRARLDLEARG